jgi:hypothetical protein
MLTPHMTTTDPSDSRAQQTTGEWWNNKLPHFNKGLALWAALVIPLTVLLFFVVGSSLVEMLSVLPAGCFVYLFYMGTMNAFFILSEFADRLFFRNADLVSRETFYKWFYRISVGIPVIYPLFLVYAILTSNF